MAGQEDRTRPNHFDVEWADDFRDCLCTTFCDLPRINCSWCEKNVRKVNYATYKEMKIGDLIAVRKEKHYVT